MTNPFLNPNFPFHQHEEIRKQLPTWFFNSSIKDYQKLLKKNSESDWQSQGFAKALHLFHLAAEHVPAYKKFLHLHHINHQLIKTPNDFQQVPPTDKPSYFMKYPLEECAWHGDISKSNTVSFSSGSTGKPFLWPRGTYQDFEGAFAFEHLLTSLFNINQKSTLLVNCFSMGNYVAGVYVYTSTHLIAQKGYPLTVVSPGINYQDTFHILEKIIDKYDQIILCGYPPFLRDIVELGPTYNIEWSHFDTKFFFASEFFSESWRDNTLLLAGNQQPITNSTNIFGTADSAIFAFETPLSILLRKIITQYPPIHQTLFKSSLTPTFVQYNPLLTYFENIGQELALTSNSGLPLIRYNIKDQGGILTNQTIKDTLALYDINLDREINKHQLDKKVSDLPHVYITNRTDGAASFYAILIFPEYIRTGLETDSLRGIISGKFSLQSGLNRAHQPTLTIHVELHQDIKPTKALTKTVQDSIVRGLRIRCAEYSFLEKSIKSRAKPTVILHEKGDPKYFKIGIKQKWILP